MHATRLTGDDKLDRERPKEGSNDEWRHLHDGDARIEDEGRAHAHEPQARHPPSGTGCPRRVALYRESTLTLPWTCPTN